MRWLADECVDAGLVKLLRDAGNDVLYAADAMPGATDEEILACAEDEARLLPTEDKDFGELVFRSEMEVPGLVLLRIDPGARGTKGTRLERAIAHYGESLFGRYVVVERARIRSRPLLRPVG